MIDFAYIKSQGAFSFDLETYAPRTNNSDGLVYWMARIRLISIASGDKSWVIDLGLWESEIDTVELTELNSLFADMSITKVVHNSMFDLPVWSYFVKTRLKLGYTDYCRIIDTQFCSKYIWAGMRIGHDLRSLAARVLKIEMDKTYQKSDFGALFLSEEQITYSQKDAEITLHIYQHIKAMYSSADTQYLVFLSQMSQAIPVFVDMVIKGIPCDINQAKLNLAKHQQRLIELEGYFKIRYPNLETNSVTYDVASSIYTVYPEENTGLLEMQKTIKYNQIYPRHVNWDASSLMQPTLLSDFIVYQDACLFIVDLGKPTKSKIKTKLKFYDEERVRLNQNLNGINWLCSLGSKQQLLGLLTLPLEDSTVYVFPDIVNPLIKLLRKGWKADKNRVLTLATQKKDNYLLAYLQAKSLNKRIAVYNKFNQVYRNGAVYANYALAASSATGRTSSSQIGGVYGTNHQNYPKPYSKETPLYSLGNIRDCLRASKGYKFIICDYSAAHARIAASLSQDANLIKIFNEGLDSHCVTSANLVLTLNWESIKPEWRVGSLLERYKLLAKAVADKDPTAIKLRSISKTVFYLALNFGGRNRLYETLNGAVSLEECTQILASFWEVYEGLFQFCNFCKNTKPVGLTDDVPYAAYRMPTGLLRYFEVYDGNYGKATKINDVVASNWLICEGWSMFHAMSQIYTLFKNKPEWQGRVIVNCHDEIICQIKEEYALAAATSINKIMNTALSRWIKGFPVSDPIDPSSLIAQSWADK